MADWLSVFQCKSSIALYRVYTVSKSLMRQSTSASNCQYLQIISVKQRETEPIAGLTLNLSSGVAKGGREPPPPMAGPKKLK